MFGSKWTICNEDFSKMMVDDLTKYLQKRGIQLSDGGKAKRKAEIVDLCWKAREKKQPKMVINAKLVKNEGFLPNPERMS